MNVFFSTFINIKMLSNTCFEAHRQLIYSVLQFAFVICLQSHSNARHQENTIFEQVYFVPKRIYNSPKKVGALAPKSDVLAKTD